ncbi:MULTISPECIES: 2-hydroxyacid dehydrogenase [Anoxybacillus]|uniref:2-hydroxyacid dehydrogenase n=1 Tax=Anoxybacillus TaxID=150247 RepID=UPI0002A728F5|nr:D-glycerate dehydrogenase [Anoxybacillus flavithermus]ASA96778.1 D-glycerate dehydrogenase [Anoxybacillus flavithermus]ELK21026.1 2-hydroxyacid dehydrogenase [Anoxybacillus flavithermus TNO-09.006]MBE2905241.1 D-glycerate dehydrogenase [Anoxybacillus flavithermus]MBE2924365.1 D-glycerate dehydrogenase [Anoxybacillus flavithermus]MBE2927144.1 D-glycerate dehydrogenase [Anoxybacillus flavithermus]
MGRPYVFITRKLPDDIVAPLCDKYDVNMWPHEHLVVPRDILLQEASRAEALITMLSDRIDEELLKQSPKLRVVANVAVGYDNIDVEAAKTYGVIVCNTPDVLTETTADLTFALLLATARRLIEAAEFVKGRKWKSWSPLLLAGTDVHHKTIGIVGMGKIGQAVAHRAKGFYMRVLYYNRSRNIEAEKTLDATYCSFDELLRRSDFVVCLTPLTNETYQLFNRAAFAKMKSSAIFINAGRGAIVDEEALYDALIHRRIAGAGLDVFAQEPIRSDHPLLQLPNVVALPHIGSATKETRYAMMHVCCRNVMAVLEGKEPYTPVR